MPIRVLLADDSLTIQKVVELTFAGAEFEIRAVGNGDDAVRGLREFHPDIVLADAFMPGLTGYEVCERVKALPRGHAIPVVLLAGTFEPFDRARAEASGADSIVTKPFDSHALATLVRDLVEEARRRMNATPTAPFPPVRRPADLLVPPAPAPAEPALAESVGGATAEEEPFFRTEAIPIPPPAEIAEIAEIATVAAVAAVEEKASGAPPPEPEAERFELADPDGEPPAASPATSLPVGETTRPLRIEMPLEAPVEAPVEAPIDTPLVTPLEEISEDRAEAITGPIVLDDAPGEALAAPTVSAAPAVPPPSVSPEAADVFAEEPFGAPPEVPLEEEFLASESEGVQPRDIEADLEAYEQSGRGTARPEVWDQAEAMGLTGPRDEAVWPPDVQARQAIEAEKAKEAEEEAKGPVEERLAPDAGAFDLAEAEGIRHRDLEVLAAEARRTDLNELIPVRIQPEAVAPHVTTAPIAFPAAATALSDADVDRIARRFAEIVGEAAVRSVAWEVVPEIAERLVRQRIQELEAG